MARYGGAVTFRYFAYGSNMWPPRMRARCPSARIVGTAVLSGWLVVYDKPSVDGTAKLNIRSQSTGAVPGVVYEISDRERELLDRAEPGYAPLDTPVGLVYAYDGEAATVLPADWYVAIVGAGAHAHGLAPPDTPGA